MVCGLNRVSAAFGMEREGGRVAMEKHWGRVENWTKSFLIVGTFYIAAVDAWFLNLT